jgi:flavin reductase (DIM6/NTAB) family NADH-FMN oxidoreductase RutF
VAASPVACECQLHGTVSFGESTVVFGRILHIAIAESVMREGVPDIDKLRPVARIGGDDWSTVGDVLTLPLIGIEDWPAWRADFAGD